MGRSEAGIWWLAGAEIDPSDGTSRHIHADRLPWARPHVGPMRAYLKKCPLWSVNMLTKNDRSVWTTSRAPLAARAAPCDAERNMPRAVCRAPFAARHATSAKRRAPNGARRAAHALARWRAQALSRSRAPRMHAECISSARL